MAHHSEKADLGSAEPPPYHGNQQPSVGFSPAPQYPQIIQQQPITHTTVVVQNVQQVRQLRNWSSELCGCCDDCSSCMLGAFCPMILACMISDRLGESACVPCCVPGGIIALRMKLRTEQGIQGTLMDDCCMTACCGGCVLCQLDRELTFIERQQQGQPRMGSGP